MYVVDWMVAFVANHEGSVIWGSRASITMPLGDISMARAV